MVSNDIVIDASVWAVIYPDLMSAIIQVNRLHPVIRPFRGAFTKEKKIYIYYYFTSDLLKSVNLSTLWKSDILVLRLNA